MIERLIKHSTNNRTTQILIVEDEGIIARDIQDCLENLGYGVPSTAATGVEAIAKAIKLQPDLILMDIRLKGEMDGIQAAERIWNHLHIPIIYATGFSDRATLERAKLTHPFGYILKPIEEQELYAAIETALHQYRINQELQQREQWLTTVLRDMGDGVIVVDVQDRICLMNLVAEALTGWQQSEALGQPLSKVFRIVHEQRVPPVQHLITKIAAQDKTVYLPENTILLAKDGSPVPIADAATPLRDEAGTPTGAVIIFRDITRRRIAEERDYALRRAKQLETQMAELQKLNQLKDDFLNTVSHELRTPLSNMKMAIQMLEIMLNQGIASEENHNDDLSQAIAFMPSQTIHYLGILREQCNHELALVNDLLDLQRLNADTYQLTFSSIRLQDWVPHIAEYFEERILDNHQSLQITIPEDLPSLISDLSGLTRILSELLNNACKYTPIDGSITISTQLVAQQASQAASPANPSHLTLSTSSLQIRVCNSGHDLPPDELVRIFDQFYRIPHSDPRSQGGTGLGLTLVKRLTTYLQGLIWAESSGGQTCFIVELPLSPPNLPPDAL